MSACQAGGERPTPSPRPRHGGRRRRRRRADPRLASPRLPSPRLRTNPFRRRGYVKHQAESKVMKNKKAAQEDSARLVIASVRANKAGHPPHAAQRPPPPYAHPPGASGVGPVDPRLPPRAPPRQPPAPHGYPPYGPPPTGFGDPRRPMPAGPPHLSTPARLDPAATATPTRRRRRWCPGRKPMSACGSRSRKRATWKRPTA